MSRLLRRVGWATAAHPWRTLGAWLVVLLAAGGLVGAFGGEPRDNYRIAGAPSQAGLDFLAARFPEMSGTQARVVVHERAGRPLDPMQLHGLRTRLGGLRGVSMVEPPRLSADGDTALIEVRYDIPVTDFSGAEGIDALRTAARPTERAGLQVEIGGELPESRSKPDGTAEAVGFAAALVILVLTLGSFVAAGLPLVVALAGLGLGFAVIGLLAAATDVSTSAPTVASMVGLGAGIDYALLLVSRHIEGLRHGLSAVAAAAEATATAGASVVVAGSTVLVSLLGLRLAGLPPYSSFGYTTFAVVSAVMLAAVTLVPALCALTGNRLLRRAERPVVRAAHRKDPRTGQRRPPRQPPPPRPPPPAPGPQRRSRTEQWAQWVGDRPLAAGLAAAAVLAALAAPALGMRTWPQDAGSQPTSNTTRNAYDLLSAELGPGTNGPLLVAVDLTLVPEPEALARRLRAERGVAAIGPPVRNRAGDAAVIFIEPLTGPQDRRTTELVDRLRAEVLPPGTMVTGTVTVFADISRRLADRLWVVVAFVVAVSLFLLIVLFRAPVVAVKAAVMNLLSVAAAYGVITAVFQSDLGARLVGLPHAVSVSSWVPVLMFAVLFGLSMDYEVFLLARVREEWLATGDPHGSVVRGLAATARVITSAAAIMVAVFIGFALDPDVTVKMIGVGMASAILVDATVVRMVLVPATMALLGRANWWRPGWMGRVLPQVAIEHGYAPPPGPATPFAAKAAPHGLVGQRFG
ncbi:MAG TPA: MMPL family transporter [Micromonosporaceae bacterium]|nr:MMPL family transporter [Micromonosporaceae bacterium]